MTSTLAVRRHRASVQVSQNPLPLLCQFLAPIPTLQRPPHQLALLQRVHSAVYHLEGYLQMLCRPPQRSRLSRPQCQRTLARAPSPGVPCLMVEPRPVPALVRSPRFRSQADPRFKDFTCVTVAPRSPKSLRLPRSSSKYLKRAVLPLRKRPH